MQFLAGKVFSAGLLLVVISACSGGGSGSDGGGGPTTPAKNDEFVTFETGQVRPLALSPDGNTLYAANTPNSSLEVYSIGNASLTYSETVPVGMEPTAVAAIGNQVWVVNHLSDSVSVIDVSVTPAKVIRTLLVGDEPRDIVFANQFAFITTAHRGQNGPADTPVDAELTTAGVGRADVWVFDTTNIGSSLGGDPVNVITLFGDTPRALTVSSDGNTVYAAIFLSGNQTTTIGENNLAKPVPFLSFDNILQPDTGLILKFNGTNWADGTGSITDGLGTLWDTRVNLSLPDYDVFEINAAVNPPVANGVRHSGVGTVLFNMVTNPVSDKVYVSNTKALNEVRFEGPGGGGSTVRGHFAESRISVIDAGVVTSLHLNKHINYGVCCADNPAEKAAALAQPTDMAISGDGSRLYVAAFGSQKIGFFDTATLENNSFTPNASNQIMLSAGGPAGVVLDDQVRNQLYVLTRFDNGLSVIDIAAASATENEEVFHTVMFNPEPAHVIEGRQFLYDANVTSSHGDSSCALCHVFGDFDGLAWDLGNPDETVVANDNPFASPVFLGIPVPLRPDNPVFHPMKGPMATQSLRGLEGNGPMHWRGDRVGASAQAGESIELGAFKDFNVAFEGLIGRASQLAADDMQVYAEFALEITYPPNPIRALDNSLTTDQAAGRNIYLNDFTTGGGVLTCNDCHVLNVTEGHFGTSGLSSVEGSDISQEFKIPHLRNMYQKVGKFGVSGKFAPPMAPSGPQIKGFGFMHDGGMDTLDNFLSGSVFEFDPDPTVNSQKRGQVVDFVMAMDSELAPIVGQQITLSADSGLDVSSRIDLLRARAQATNPVECDLIVKGVIDGQIRGALMQSDGSYQMDRQSEVMSDIDLRALVNLNNQTLTFTCVPPGSGTWMGIDRDIDGVLDGDEIDAGTDPLVANL
jgi:YVTN family beta-propeller protein